MDNNWFIEELTEWCKNNKFVFDDRELVRITDAKGTTNPFYGKKHSEEWKQAASERMKGNKNTSGYKCKREHVEKRAISRSRPVTIFGITYSSGREAAKQLGVSPSTIVLWKKNGQ